MLCPVVYNMGETLLSLLDGWMGWLIEHFGAGMLHQGVEDSLARLKRAAEALHGERDPSLRSG